MLMPHLRLSDLPGRTSGNQRGQAEAFEHQGHTRVEMGIGTDESIILGIDKVCDLAEAARKSGLWPTDDMYPNVVKMRSNQNSFPGEVS